MPGHPHRHKNSEKKSKFRVPGAHGFEEKTKYHVPGYMDLKKKQNSIYRGTWTWKKNILMCSSGGGGGPAQKNIFFLAIFFQHVKKLINFGNFVKIKVAKFKLNHLG